MSKEKEKEKAATVTLKRTVTIKAVVTEKFKEYMMFEIQEAIKVAQFKIGDIQKKAESVAKGGNGPDIQNFRMRLEAERFELTQSIGELQRRMDSVKTLQLNTHFVQGMVDGFVAVNTGDNLYEKLGAMEIIIKDGLVQHINAVGKIEPLPQ